MTEADTVQADTEPERNCGSLQIAWSFRKGTSWNVRTQFKFVVKESLDPLIQSERTT